MKKGINKRFIFICLTLSVGVFASGCSIFPKEEGEAKLTSLELSKPEYNQYTVKKGNIYKNVVIDGILVPAKQYDLSFNARAGVLKVLNVKEGDYVKKGQLLAELDGETLKNEIKMQQINLEKAKRRYDSLVAEKAGELELKAAEFDVEAEKLQLEDLQNEYSKITLVSNVDGRVVYCPKMNIGMYIELKNTVIKVAAIEKIQVQCNDYKINNFNKGAKVTIKYKGKEYTGTVASFDDEQAAASDNSSSAAQYSSMRVDIDKKLEGEDFGKTVVVTMEMEKKEDIITIPKRLVKISGNNGTVLVLENNKKIEKTIELGIDNDKDIEVIKGLKEGDILIE